MPLKKLCVSFILIFYSFIIGYTQQTVLLNKHWQFAKCNKNIWYKAEVPGTIHTDLLYNNLIENPFYRDNETKLQWISKTNWQYKKKFQVSATLLQQKNIQLIFEGLDTYATVYLNQQLILQANNMFRTWSIDVKKIIKQKNNQLLIIFNNADAMSDSLAKASTTIYPSENNRNFIRKAQYHFGWDFAPKLTTCGIWRNVKLLAYNTTEQIQKKESLKNNFPKVELIQEKDSLGQSFYFTLNQKPIFIKGANWVPADVFLPSISKTKYRTLLIAAKKAHINMLRVWGGGIYEDDYFYTLCDSLNILVWQDFMFAGAMYEATETNLQNIKQEAIDNIKRLQKHPCIAVWCGNNEIDEAWHNWGWQKQFKISEQDSVKLWNEYKKIFHELLPSLVEMYDKHKRPYITTSPQIGWGRKESLTQGDCHYWGVWWGLQSLETYHKKVPRFMSEYGMQAMPNFSSIKKFSINQDWDTSSTVMKLHQKHATGFQNLKTYLQQNNFKPKNFQEYIIATQRLQAKALQTGITTHLQAKPNCMGTMLWQLNDCYPAISWSIIDYYGAKKLAYYTVQKLYK